MVVDWLFVKSTVYALCRMWCGLNQITKSWSKTLNVKRKAIRLYKVMVSLHGYSCLCENTAVIPEPPQWHYPRYSHSGHHGTPSTRTFPSTTERRREGQNEILHWESSRVSLKVLQACEVKVKHRKGQNRQREICRNQRWNVRVLDPLTMSHRGKKLNKEKKKKFEEQKKEPKFQKERCQKRKMRKGWWKRSREDADLCCAFLISKNGFHPFVDNIFKANLSAALSALTSQGDWLQVYYSGMDLLTNQGWSCL